MIEGERERGIEEEREKETERGGKRETWIERERERERERGRSSALGIMY